jgi:hypothetical protein
MRSAAHRMKWRCLITLRRIAYAAYRQKYAEFLKTDFRDTVPESPAAF